MTDFDDNLEALAAAWQSERPRAKTDALTRYVRRRSQMLTIWVAIEMSVGIVGLLVVAVMFVIRPDPLERLAMGALAVVCAGASVFSWWNWRGTFQAIGESTSVYLDLSAMRLRRLRRDMTVSLILLAAQLAVFIPWVWYRQQAVPNLRWPWVFLASMTVFGIGGVMAIGRWVRREEAVLERLRQELGQDQGSGIRDQGSEGLGNRD